MPEPAAVDPAAPDPAMYGDAIADVYDEWYADISDVEGTVTSIARLAAGGPVLELGVGTGRIALPLAAAGVEIHGVDASHAMVERLRAKPGGEQVDVLAGDFAEDLPRVAGGFAVVFVAFNTLCNLTAPGAVERCMGLVAEALRPDGAFVVEAFVPGDDPVASGVDVRRIDADEVVLSVFRRDPSGETVSGSLVSLSAAGGVRLRPWALRPMSPDALDTIARAAGFTLERRDGGWRQEPFDDGSDRHVTVYRRSGGTFERVIRS